jgi:hypothetical protein
MLSPETLNRVSNSFRRGYYDGYFAREHSGKQTNDPLHKPFANFDYDEGYKAGKNDAKWNKFYSK